MNGAKTREVVQTTFGPDCRSHTHLRTPWVGGVPEWSLGQLRFMKLFLASFYCKSSLNEFPFSVFFFWWGGGGEVSCYDSSYLGRFLCFFFSNRDCHRIYIL